jgi:hypothetical protein
MSTANLPNLSLRVDILQCDQQGFSRNNDLWDSKV